MDNKILNILLIFTLIIICVVMFVPKKCDQVLMYFSIFISFSIIILDNNLLKLYGGFYIKDIDTYVTTKIKSILTSNFNIHEKLLKLILLQIDAQKKFSVDIKEKYIDNLNINGEPVNLKDLKIYKCNNDLKKLVTKLDRKDLELFPKERHVDIYSIRLLIQMINEIENKRIVKIYRPYDVKFLNELKKIVTDKNHNMSITDDHNLWDERLLSNDLYMYLLDSIALKKLLKINNSKNDILDSTEYSNIIRECNWTPRNPDCNPSVSVRNLLYLRNILSDAENHYTYKQSDYYKEQKEREANYEPIYVQNTPIKKTTNIIRLDTQSNGSNVTKQKITPKHLDDNKRSFTDFIAYMLGINQTPKLNYKDYIDSLTLEQKNKCKAMDAINYKSENRNVVCKENGINPKYQLKIHPDKNIGCNEFSNIINKDIGNYCDSN